MKTYLTAMGRTDRTVEEVDWQAVYTDCLPRVFHFFCYKIGNAQVAEELTSITFEKAWAGRGGFRKERGQASAWLLGIARNVAGDYFRKPSREVPLEEVPGLRAASSLDEDLQRRLDFQSISALLARLPGRERELIALKYGADLTNREIARLTGLSESNVGTILHRVVVKLRGEWEQDHEG